MKIYIYKSVFISVMLFLSTCLCAQNKVGIGTLTPDHRLHIASADSALLKLDNTTGLNPNIRSSLFFKTGTLYTGAIKTIGDTYNEARMGFFTYAASNPFTVKERLSILDGGNIGIGTTSPGYILDVNGRGRLRQAGGLTAGLWYNKSDNVATTFAGMQSDTSWGLYSSGYKFIFDMDNGRLGIGGVTAQYPLAFLPNLGDKISLYGGGGAPNVDHYGLGIQANLMQLFTPLSSTDIAFGYGRSSVFTELMRIKGNGNVGIGVINPADAGLVVNKKVGAVNAMFGRNTTGVAIESANPAIGLNCYFNAGRKTIATGYTGLLFFDPTTGNLGLYNSNVSTATDAATSVLPRIFIDKDGEIGVEGNTAPHAQLSFANNVGSKISLFGSVESSNYGFGIQSSLLQMYTASSVTDIAFGYGGSTSFTERMRIKGNGNVGIGNDPVFPLDISGRVRIRHVGANTPGIWFNKPDNTQGSFIGQYDATNFGIWGPGSAGSWKFLFDGNDGTLRIGTLEKATGYLVNIGGKIIAEEMRVQLEASWPDYVFNSDYSLMPLEELDEYIQVNNHLPGFEKAAVYEKEGADVGETQRKLVEKVEELTLYVIELKKEIEQLKNNKISSNKSKL